MSTEKLTQRHILAWLDHNGYLAWRNQSGMVFTGKFRMQLAPAGSPDIVGMTKTGRFLGIEVKGQHINWKSEQQSESQVRFQQKMEASGGLYILARSVEDVQSALNMLELMERSKQAYLNSSLSRTEPVEPSEPIEPTPESLGEKYAA